MNLFIFSNDIKFKILVIINLIYFVELYICKKKNVSLNIWYIYIKVIKVLKPKICVFL
jgi:hypothetical protein